MGDVGNPHKQISILLVCYGDYPHYSGRAIASLAATPDLRQHCDVHVGCNACCPETIAIMRRHRDAGVIDTLIESQANLNKDPMLRHLLQWVATPYVLIMDDDSHVRSPWLDAMLRFLRRHDPLDVAGQLFCRDRTPPYQPAAERRPWWRGMDHVPPDQRQRIVYATGGLLLARTAFLRDHGWPDAGLVVEFEDVLLCDLVHHVGGKLLPFDSDILASVSISDGERRWSQAVGRNDQHIPGAAPAASPPEASQLLRQGIAQFRAGRFAEAEALAQQMLSAQAGDADGLHLLGMVAHATRRDEKALDLMQQAIAVRPGIPDYHNNLGNVFAKLNRLEEAEAAFRRALSLKDDYAEAHNNLANLLNRHDRAEAAIEHYERALSLKPQYPEAQANLANTYRSLGRGEKVAECARRAIQLNPRSADAYNQLALVAQEQGRLEEALQAIDRAIALRPQDGHLQLNKAFMLLLAGDFEHGWPQYEWRFSLPENRERLRFPQPLWNGESLRGKSILLHCEQGLGATIQFVRYAIGIAAQAKRTVLECQPALKTLLRLSLPPAVQIFARGEPLPPFDVHLPLLSLPRVMKTTLESIPCTTPYLKADPALVQQWLEELARIHGRRIGIAWQGNPHYGGDRQRSFSLEHFAALADLPDVNLLSLQKNKGSEQVEQHGQRLKLIDLAPRLDERTGAFMDTTALMMSLDLVVTSDTSIAHLAGALGVRVWVALSSSPDWRWMQRGERYPWYQRMRLFRQRKPGDWDEVFQRMAGELQQHSEPTLCVPS